MIWSGTWEFSPETISMVTLPRRDQLLILASERNLNRYDLLADAIDGNAYYWSSVNPETFPGYQEKLDSMADSVHEHGGLWVAPVAPGFDARLIGGHRVVDRRRGETLVAQFNAAMRSNPDIVGVISWNEFTENSHIEPSREHGNHYIEVLADLTGIEVSVAPSFDSDISDLSASRSRGDLYWERLALLVMLGGLLALSLGTVVRRTVRENRS
jgi:hypothetical protein